ncbi:MAG: hypothetical protein ABSG86_26220 [Thermoguttaceae bacterium]|jgi:hypothetical protein
MKISLRLAELLGDKANRRGVLSEIQEECGIERHTVVSWLGNKARYVSLDALGQIADYLAKRGVNRDILPGALLGRDPEYFWEALATCKRLHFCLGTRRSPQWAGSDYVMSSDALLQGQMLTEISNRVYRANGAAAAESPRPPGGESQAGGRAGEARHDQGAHPSQPAFQGGVTEQAVAHSLFPEFHLLAGPERTMTAANLGRNWAKSKAEALKLYDEFSPEACSALIALGSIKVNPLVEVILARAFSAAPFVTQDDVERPRDRKCPILFRYREEDKVFGHDPQPPACCGGVKLAANTPAPLYGMYHETLTGKWEGCPWDLASNDVAFLFYAYRPANVQVEVACGGFSARATRCLAAKLQEITRKLGKPQLMSESLHMGVYLINFAFDPEDQNYSRDYDERDCDVEVIALDEKVLSTRLGHKRTTRRRVVAPLKKVRRK